MENLDQLLGSVDKLQNPKVEFYSKSLREKQLGINNIFRDLSNQRSGNAQLKKSYQVEQFQSQNTRNNYQGILNKENSKGKIDFSNLNEIYEQFIKQDEKKALRSQSQKNCKSQFKTYKTQQQLLKEKDKTFKEQCTFKPQINLTSRSRQKIDQRSMMQRLSTPKSETIQKREQLKRLYEDEQMQQYSFQPQINASSLNNTFSKNQTLSVQDRLYLDSEKYTEREQIKRFQEEQELLKYPFKPQIRSKSALKQNYTPIHLRYRDIQKQKKDRMRLQQEKLNNSTFTPRINKRSSTLASLKKRQKEIKLNQTIESENSTQRLDFNKFYQRQIDSQKSIEQKRKLLKEQLDSEYSYQPQIEKQSKYFAACSTQKIITNKKQTEQFDFKPKINQISQLIGNKTDYQEYNNKLKQTKRKLIEEREAENEKQCSFQPKINQSKYKHVKSYYQQKNDIITQIQEQKQLKQQTIKNAKKIRKEQELKQCTFKPETNLNATKLNTSLNSIEIHQDFEQKQLKSQKTYSTFYSNLWSKSNVSNTSQSKLSQYQEIELLDEPWFEGELSYKVDQYFHQSLKWHQFTVKLLN